MAISPNPGLNRFPTPYPGPVPGGPFPPAANFPSEPWASPASAIPAGGFAPPPPLAPPVILPDQFSPLPASNFGLPVSPYIPPRPPVAPAPFPNWAGPPMPAFQVPSAASLPGLTPPPSYPGITWLPVLLNPAPGQPAIQLPGQQAPAAKPEPPVEQAMPEIDIQPELAPVRTPGKPSVKKLPADLLNETADPALLPGDGTFSDQVSRQAQKLVKHALDNAPPELLQQLEDSGFGHAIQDPAQALERGRAAIQDTLGWLPERMRAKALRKGLMSLPPEYQPLGRQVVSWLEEPSPLAEKKRQGFANRAFNWGWNQFDKYFNPMSWLNWRPRIPFIGRKQEDDFAFEYFA